MKYIIKCISVFTLAFYIQAVAAADNAANHSAAVKKENLDIRITNAFVYIPLGASKTTTGFFTIDNRSASEIRITGVTSNFAKQIKLMPNSPWIVAAHDSLVLNPKGNFLQINDLKARLSTGDELHLSVSLSNGQQLQFTALAKSAYDQIHGH
ncbi:MAG: copper chaperone PCu(A)C [Gammaproteobacteria bacterium]|nr:MAG: copper chaperone PCu(A)C [Gammaproteobacteria bacterium]